MHLTLSGHEIELLSEHAVFLPQSSTLILSDVHLGKAATFQAHGLPVPQGDDAKDLQRISHLLEKKQAHRLVIAGDLLHSPIGLSPALITQLQTWMDQCPAQITLVRGNHDARALKAHPITNVPSLNLDGIEIIHDPADASDQFAISGHLHPVIQIKDKQHRKLRTPCFWLTPQSLILPSFGTFTGGQPIKPKPIDRVFAPLHNRIIELPASSFGFPR